jgi:CheY-like chemotaxis protein
MTILYIEDEQDDRELFLRCLKSARPGACCVFAHSGHEGISVLRNTFIRPDVIVIDFSLPMLSGLEVLRRLKLTPELHQIPCYLFTETTDVDLCDEAMKAGAHGSFRKPVHLSDLTQLIKQMLN